MENIYSKEIQQFIAANNLTRKAGIMLFDALVVLETKSRIHSFSTQVQVINLDNITAVYIFELFKSEYGLEEMYSTEKHQFTCNGKYLEVRLKDQQDLFISIRVIPNTRISSIA